MREGGGGGDGYWVLHDDRDGESRTEGSALFVDQLPGAAELVTDRDSITAREFKQSRTQVQVYTMYMYTLYVQVYVQVYTMYMYTLYVQVYVQVYTMYMYTLYVQVYVYTRIGPLGFRFKNGFSISGFLEFCFVLYYVFIVSCEIRC